MLGSIIAMLFSYCSPVTPYAFGTRAVALYSIFLLRLSLRRLKAERRITFTPAYGVVKASIQQKMQGRYPAFLFDEYYIFII